MNVAELIEILNKCPQDAEVHTYPPEWYKFEPINWSDIRYSEQQNIVEIG